LRVRGTLTDALLIVAALCAGALACVKSPSTQFWKSISTDADLLKNVVFTTPDDFWQWQEHDNYTCTLTYDKAGDIPCGEYKAEVYLSGIKVQTDKGSLEENLKSQSVENGCPIPDGGIKFINPFTFEGQPKGQYDVKVTWFTGAADASDAILSYELSLCNA